MTTTDLAAFDFRDAGAIIAEVALREPLRAGDVRVALVRSPATDQELVAVVDLPAEEWQGLDRWDLSEYLAGKVEPVHVRSCGDCAFAGALIACDIKERGSRG